jgi:hypothetical protein
LAALKLAWIVSVRLGSILIGAASRLIGMGLLPYSRYGPTLGQRDRAHCPGCTFEKAPAIQFQFVCHCAFSFQNRFD